MTSATFTSVEIKTPYTCASCGQQFFDGHTCPTTPSRTLPFERHIIRLPVTTGILR